MTPFTARQALWRQHLPQPPLCPSFLHGWLTHPASLTARLRTRCTHFALQLQRQQRARPLPDEAHALKIRPQRQAWLREVLLLADGEAVVFARSWLLSSCGQIRCPIFFNAGTQPLGERLFRKPAIARSPLQKAILSAPDPRYQLAQRYSGQPTPNHLWMRRSCFNIATSRLLITEIFLPAIANLQP